MSSELKSKIESRYTESYKSKNESVFGVLRLILSALKNLEIQKKAEATDEDVIAILKREVSSREESIELYKKGQREDLAAKEASEISLIRQFLPAQLSPDQVRETVEATVKELGIADKSRMGQVIGAVMAKIGSQTDGKTVSAIVLEILSQ